MAPSQLPPIFNATSQDIEMLLSAQAHVGSKNIQTHMLPYLFKTRADGVNIINIGKTWYVNLGVEGFEVEGKIANKFGYTGRRSSSLPVSSQLLTTQLIFVLSLPVHMVNVLS
jgi:hypothetical protein